jgi:hypothetical protein
MEQQDVLTYLNALGVELERRALKGPIKIMVVGGVYMVLNIYNRPSTEDVDIAFISENGESMDLTSLPLSKEEKTFRAAIKAVAKQYKLKQAWLNDDAGPFVKAYVPSPMLTFWHTFGPLHVYFPDHATMLCYKLLGYSQKQQADIYALCDQLGISSYDEVKAIVDRLVPKKIQRDFEVEDTLDELFE